MNRTSTLALACLVLGATLVFAPTFGFDSAVVDRGVSFGVSDADGGYLAIEATDTVVDDHHDRTEVLRLTNNADTELTLDTETTIDDDGFEEVSDFDRTLSPGETTAYSVACRPGSGTGETTVETVVRAASGDGITIEGVEETVAVERDCPGPPAGGGEPDAGFETVSADSVSPSVDPGEERQQFGFVLAESREPHEQIEIDLGEPQAGAVDYTETFRNDDVRVEAGDGQVRTSDDGTLVYQVAPRDGHDDEIVLSVGGYATDGDGGPDDAAFTRIGADETETMTFGIDAAESD